MEKEVASIITSYGQSTWKRLKPVEPVMMRDVRRKRTPFSNNQNDYEIDYGINHELLM